MHFNHFHSQLTHILQLRSSQQDMATTSSEQTAASHVESHTDTLQSASTPQRARGDVEVPLPPLEFAEAVAAKALVQQIVPTLYVARHILVVEAVVNMCSVPLGHALLSIVPVTANPFESASLFTTCIVAIVWAYGVFFVTFFCFFAPLMVAMFRARCYLDLLYRLFYAYCIPGRGNAWARKLVVLRAALLELLKVICLALFSLAYRSLGGGETAHAVLTPSQAFLSMVVGKMTIGLIKHWLSQGDMAYDFNREGSTLDGKDSGYASTAASEGDV